MRQRKSSASQKRKDMAKQTAVKIYILRQLLEQFNHSNTSYILAFY
jgi:hypothetical protein